MKHLTPESSSELRSLLNRSGLTVSARAQEAMLAYLDELLAANQVLNLTRILDPAMAIRMHIVDSLLALPEVHEARNGVMIDLGSGGGFPGVPLGIAANRRTVLLDSVKKKGTAVLSILRGADVYSSISVSSERAEEHAREHGGEYAVVVARAVAPLPTLVELASPLLRTGGALVVLKGQPSEAELRSGERAGELTGLDSWRRRVVTLPGGPERRTIVSAVKSGTCAIELPRRNGVAQKHPLA